MVIMKISNKDAMHDALFPLYFSGLSACHFLFFLLSLLSWRAAGGLYSSLATIYRELSTKASLNPRSKTMDTGPLSKLNHLLQTE